MKQMKVNESVRNTVLFASHFQILKRFVFCHFMTLSYIKPLRPDLSAQWTLE